MLIRRSLHNLRNVLGFRETTSYSAQRVPGERPEELAVSAFVEYGLPWCQEAILGNMNWVSESDKRARYSSNWGMHECGAEVQRGQKSPSGEALCIERLLDAAAGNMAEYGVELRVVPVAPENVWTVTYRCPPERPRVILVVSTRPWGKGEQEMRCAVSQVMFICEAIGAGRASELDLHRYDRHSRDWYPLRHFVVEAE